MNRATCLRCFLSRANLKPNVPKKHVLKRFCVTSPIPQENWILCSAVCLERKAVITPNKTNLESKYSQLMSQLELEHSLLSDHELRHRAEIIKKDKKAEQEASEDGEQSIQTALDLEDMWDSELKAFKLASRITDADTKDDKRSPDRKLDRKLILIVKLKLGDESHWMLPQGIREDGESMRESAERTLRLYCGDGMNAQFLGNAPCGFYKYKFPKSMREDPKFGEGAKVFFFKAAYAGGTLDLVNCEDFMWVTREELSQYLHPKYYKSLDDFIIEL